MSQYYTEKLSEIRLGSSKVFYDKSIEYNSKHAFRKMNGYYKYNEEIKEMLKKRYPL